MFYKQDIGTELLGQAKGLDLPKGILSQMPAGCKKNQVSLCAFS